MALQLSISIEKNSSCTGYTFTDLTGAYNATTNPTGYGSPNPTTSASAAVLIITKYNLPDDGGDTITYDEVDLLTDYSFPSSADLAVALNLEDLTIDSDDGALDSFGDGVYRFQYKVTYSDGAIYTTSVEKLFMCGIECSLLEQAYKIANSECNCKDKDFLQMFNELMSLYYAVRYAGACGNKTTIGKNLQNITDLLQIVGCRNC